MNNSGFRTWLKETGTLRASLLFVALAGKLLLYIFNPPSFMSKQPPILPFPFLVGLDLIAVVVTSLIAAECVRIGFPSTSSWSLKKHFAVAGILIALFAAADFCMIPQTSKRYFSYSWSLADKGNYNQAILSLDIAVKYYPKNRTAYLERAYVHRRLGDFVSALKDCDRAMEVAPNFAKGHACRGYSYYYLCDHEKALEELNKAISLDPKLSDGLEKWIAAAKKPLNKC
jgi:tetratricopeptide (TPR) repeat protein